jgi:hypothetical protein
MIIIIIIIIVATGTISSFRQYPSNIPGKQEIKELQKNSHIGHCTHITGRANVKVQNMFHGRNNMACSTNCRAATLHVLETWFVLSCRFHPFLQATKALRESRSISLLCFYCTSCVAVDTMRKGDNKNEVDNDDDDDYDNNNNNNNNNIKQLILGVK